MRGRKKIISILASVLLGATALSGCGNSSDASDKIIRIGMPSPGEAGQKVWDAAIAKFKEANPEWDVQLIIQDDDIYSTVGLQGLLLVEIHQMPISNGPVHELCNAKLMVMQLI